MAVIESEWLPINELFCGANGDTGKKGLSFRESRGVSLSEDEDVS